MIQNIIKEIARKEEADRLLSGIDLVLKSLFNVKKENPEAILKKFVDVNTFKTLKEILSEYGNSKQDLSNFLNDLKSKLHKLKIIKLAIAFDPTINSIDNISSWIKENLGEEYILDIEKNPAILGGAIIVYGGRYQDLSLKKQLDEVFEKKRNEIVKLLNC